MSEITHIFLPLFPGKGGGYIFHMDDRSFRKAAAKAIEETKQVLGLLEGILSHQNSVTNNVIVTRNAIATECVGNALKRVSIYELVKENTGIDVKSIFNAGFHNYLDLYNAEVNELTAIPGISFETALNIKNVLDAFVRNAASRVKFRINYDRQGSDYSALVQALSVYIKFKPIYSACQRCIGMKDQLYRAIYNLEPAKGMFQWFFTGRKKRDIAFDAIKTLYQFLQGGFTQQAINLSNELNAVYNTTEAEAWEEFKADPIKFYNALEELFPGTIGDPESFYGLTEDLARAIKNEITYLLGFKSTLRRYQEWGVKYILHQKKVLLGDEMGLGKTIQAIAAMVSLQNTGSSHFFVVCPAGVLANWCREITQHSCLKPIKIHGQLKNEFFEEWLTNGGVGVTTYDTLKKLKIPESMPLHMLVVDEAHYIKNPAAARTSRVCKLCDYTDHILFMTGTALENNIDEMIGLMYILNPEIADRAEKFAFMANVPEFMGVIAPVYYRRKREDVLEELPDLVEKQDWVRLCAQEEIEYDFSLCTRNFHKIRQVSYNVEDISNSSKIARLLELVEEAKAENRKVIIFSNYLDTITKVCKCLEWDVYGPIYGGVSPKQRQEIVDEFNSSIGSTVLLSQIVAGGVGLNIQSASVIILCEPQLKPSIENQAISRAHRMGQARNVIVHRLLALNTIDERIMEILHTKQRIFDAYADDSVAAGIDINELDGVHFSQLVESEIRRRSISNHLAS